MVATTLRIIALGLILLSTTSRWSFACTNDQQCKGERVCLNHQCTAAPTPKAMSEKCRKDTDCPGDAICETSQCRLPDSKYSPAQTSSKYPVEIQGKDGAPMRIVPEGKFRMGNYQDGTERDEELKAFYMDVYEVTNARYLSFLRQSNHRDEFGWNASRLNLKLDETTGQLPYATAGPNDADAYCRFYGKRLPNILEWEKAARGTDKRNYPWGDNDPTSSHAAFGLPKGSLAKPVGSYEKGKSPYGMYDMAGNVEEIAEDEDTPMRKYGTNYSVRGGSLSSDKNALLAWKDDSLEWEVMKEYLVNPNTYKYYFEKEQRKIGFRCVLEPKD